MPSISNELDMGHMEMIKKHSRKSIQVNNNKNYSLINCHNTFMSKVEW